MCVPTSSTSYCKSNFYCAFFKLIYFSFSNHSLQVLRRVLYTVAKSYRLDTAEFVAVEDEGSSVSAYNATVVPLLKQSTTLMVKRVVSLGDFMEAVEQAKGEGWADESDNEEDGDGDAVKVGKEDLQ